MLSLASRSPATLAEAAGAAVGTEDGLSSVGSADAPSAESSTQPFARAASRAEADEQMRLAFQGTPTTAMRRPKAAWQGSPSGSGTSAGIRVWTQQQTSEHERWDLGRAPSGEGGGANPTSGSGRAGSGSRGSTDPTRMEPLRKGPLLEASLAEEPKGVVHAKPPCDGSADAPVGGGMEPKLAWPAPPQIHERPGARGVTCSGEDLVRQSSKVGHLPPCLVTCDSTLAAVIRERVHHQEQV